MFLANFNNADPSRPSFFEMLAQQEMISILKPAIKYVFDVLAQRHPKMEIFSRHSDEVFSIGLAVLENHYLRNYGNYVTFIMNFFSTFLPQMQVLLKTFTASREFAPKL